MVVQETDCAGHSDIESLWDREWSWHDYPELVRDIKRDEWRHLVWFFKNANWRRGWGQGGQFAVTGCRHGGQAGVATSPCGSLYKLLLSLRDLLQTRAQEPDSPEAWEALYKRVVPSRDSVMHKRGSTFRQPNVIDWPPRR